MAGLDEAITFLTKSKEPVPKSWGEVLKVVNAELSKESLPEMLIEGERVMLRIDGYDTFVTVTDHQLVLVSFLYKRKNIGKMITAAIITEKTGLTSSQLCALSRRLREKLDGVFVTGGGTGAGYGLRAKRLERKDKLF